ncbi:MAG: iron transporter, partial [Verrucomicrobiales bacterium]|nr:iron transporter [Verrucomicrobiales bacterium]
VDEAITVLDLPGTYSLSPQSLDERISRDVLLNHLPEVPPPNLVLLVLDASNLERNLYYATQVIELGYPTFVALNMMDVAEQNGHSIDAGELTQWLGVPVFPIIASLGTGLPKLKEAILEKALDQSGTRRQQGTPRKIFCDFTPEIADELKRVIALLNQNGKPRVVAVEAEALLLLTDDKFATEMAPIGPLRDEIDAARQRLENKGHDWRSFAIEARYQRIGKIQREVVTESGEYKETFSDKLDRVLTHKIWGLLIFLGIMALMFQSIFSFARLPMDLLQNGVGWFGERVSRLLGPGDLQSLLVDGIIAGVGAVVVFLPQICLLFLFIGLLEDTGYMARAAFLMDRMMSKVGLHGKSFIPMLSSFACAIPGIMATRTIETPKDRLVTILVAPLMSCSARLPVYTLLIAACIPDRRILGFFKLAGLTMLAMYLLGIVMALLMAWLFKKTLLRGETPLLIMELPPYKRPVPKVVLRHMWDRSQLFLKRAGTVILGISILLWFMATYPRNSQLEAHYKAERSLLEQNLPKVGPEKTTAETKLNQLDKEQSGERLRHSFAGKLGRLIEPAIAPLGFDWKIGIGIIASFAAREVFVSTMSTVYNVGESQDSDASRQTIAQTLREQTRPNGAKLFTPLLAVTLMVFYVFALQCVSTVAIVRRETNSWKWPVFQWVYMGVLAWGLAFVTYQGGRLLGWE